MAALSSCLRGCGTSDYFFLVVWFWFLPGYLTCEWSAKGCVVFEPWGPELCRDSPSMHDGLLFQLPCLFR